MTQKDKQEIMAHFQRLSDGFAKQGTETGNRISNEYLSAVSYIEQTFAGTEVVTAEGRYEEMYMKQTLRVSILATKIQELMDICDQQLGEVSAKPGICWKCEVNVSFGTATGLCAECAVLKGQAIPRIGSGDWLGIAINDIQNL